jgi:hypothetical protein
VELGGSRLMRDLFGFPITGAFLANYKSFDASLAELNAHEWPPNRRHSEHLSRCLIVDLSEASQETVDSDNRYIL